MDSLNKLILFRKKYHEDKMWAMIFDIGWGIKSLDYKFIRKNLLDRYLDKDLLRLKEFVKYKRKELCKILTEYEIKIRIKNYFRVSDDGFWDLTAHIVGLGKERYDSIIENPEIAQEISINYMYKENFQYIFNKN